MKGSLYPHVYKLWLFSLVATHGSFKRAAIEANLTVSALSQSVGTLERLLGKTLLVRNQGPTTLTDDGGDVLERAAPILEAIEALVLGQPPCQGTRTKRLRLGLHETMAAHHLARLAPALLQAIPGLTLQIRTARSDVLERLLREGELDAAVAVRDPDDIGPTVDVLSTGEMGFFVSERTAPDWHSAARLTLAALALHPGDKAQYLRRFLDSNLRLLRKESIDCPLTVTSDSVEALAHFAAEGLFIAALPLRAGKRHGLRRLPRIDGADGGRHDVVLVTRPSVDGPLRRILRQQATRVLKEIQ